MKRLPESTIVSLNLNDTRVFRDDIDDFVSLLGHAGLSVEISDGQFVFDSVEELRTRAGARPKQVTIKGSPLNGGYYKIELELKDRRAALYADTEFPGGLAFRVRDQVQKLAFDPLLLRFWFWWVLGAVVNVLALVLPNGDSGGHMFLVFFPLVSFAIGFTTFAIKRVVGGIHLTRRHEGGFWKRNADAVILLVIGAVAGAVVTGVIGWFASK